jgi:hypothetical protein
MKQVECPSGAHESNQTFRAGLSVPDDFGNRLAHGIGKSNFATLLGNPLIQAKALEFAAVFREDRTTRIDPEQDPSLDLFAI